MTGNVEQALSLLVQSARVSPPLRAAVRLVEDDRRRLLALLADVRDWFDAPGGDPDSSELLDRINEVLQSGDTPARGQGHEDA